MDAPACSVSRRCCEVEPEKSCKEPHMNISVVHSGAWPLILKTDDDSDCRKIFFLPRIAQTARDCSLLRLFLRVAIALPTTCGSLKSRASDGRWFPIGWSCFPGKQSTRVFGLTAPTKSRCMRFMQQEMPASFLLLSAIVEKIWATVVSLFPSESALMTGGVSETNGAARAGETGFIANTGFHKADIGIMRDMSWHKDTQNTKGSIAAVLVLGDFSGGEVCFDFSEGETAANKVDAVCNRHGSLFLGHYGSVRHRVNSVVSGTRVVLACYSTQLVYNFQKVLRVHRMSWRQAQEIKEDRKWLLRFCFPENRAKVLEAWRKDDFDGPGK